MSAVPEGGLSVLYLKDGQRGVSRGSTASILPCETRTVAGRIPYKNRVRANQYQ